MMSMQSVEPLRIAVIGGGAAGLLAAGAASQNGAEVTIFEQNKRLGKKLLITGKGRCNVTNDSPVEEIIPNVTRNARFLYSAFSALSPQDLMALLTSHGVELKTERGRRVFPVSDKSADILDALLRYTEKCTILHERVEDLLVAEGRVIGVKTSERELLYDAVIMATGGVSYPLTGSDGFGLSVAAKHGHTVTPLTPSLVPLTSQSDICRRMQGLSLRNAALTVKSHGKVIYRDFGEMLFTHFGMSGPMILSASAHLRDIDFCDLVAEFDLKPALDEKTLDTRLITELSKAPNKDLANIFTALLPSKMIPVFIDLLGIDPHKKAHTVTKAERAGILHLLKCFPVPICGFRPIEEAIVTSGGISVKEISPKTMMSKLIDNLYFAGEMIDVDAYTGGFNLQIAFSTGYLAGISASTIS